MLVTLPRMVTEVKPLQPENTIYPMLVTLPGMVTEVKPLQSQKAPFPRCLSDKQVPKTRLKSFHPG